MAPAALRRIRLTITSWLPAIFHLGPTALATRAFTLAAALRMAFRTTFFAAGFFAFLDAFLAIGDPLGRRVFGHERAVRSSECVSGVAAPLQDHLIEARPEARIAGTPAKILLEFRRVGDHRRAEQIHGQTAGDDPRQPLRHAQRRWSADAFGQ